MAPQLRWVRGGGGVGGPPPRPLSGLCGRGGGEWEGPFGPPAMPPVGGGGGGGMAVLAPGASCRPGGRALPPPPSTESRILGQALAGAPHPPAVVARAGRPGAAVRVSGQWLAGRGAAGSLPRSLSPHPLPREVARPLASCCTVGGGVGRGAQPPPPALPYPPSGPSPAPPLVWGLGLRRRRVVPAVAPVGEGAAQSPGEPVVGVRVRDAEHRSPFQESRPRRLPVGPRRPDH